MNAFGKKECAHSHPHGESTASDHWNSRSWLEMVLWQKWCTAHIWPIKKHNKIRLNKQSATAERSLFLSHSTDAIGIIRIPIRLSVCVLSSIVRIFFMNSFLLAMPRFSSVSRFPWNRVSAKTADGFSLSDCFFVCLVCVFIPFYAFFFPCCEQIKYTVFN